MKRILFLLLTVVFCFSLVPVPVAAATYEQHTLVISAEDIYNQFGSKVDYFPDSEVAHNISGSKLYLKIELGDISAWQDPQIFIFGDSYVGGYTGKVYYTPEANLRNRIGLTYNTWSVFDVQYLNDVVYIHFNNDHYFKQITINYTSEVVVPEPSINDIGYVTSLLGSISTGLWDSFQANWVSKVMFFMPFVFGIVWIVVLILKKTTDFDAKIMHLKELREKRIKDRSNGIKLPSFIPPKIKEKLLRRRYTVVNIDGVQYIKKLKLKDRRKTK